MSDNQLGSTIAERLRLFGLGDRKVAQYFEAAVDVIAETMLYSKSEELRFKAAKAMTDIGAKLQEKHAALTPVRTPGGVYIDVELEAAEAEIAVTMKAEQYVGKVPWEQWPDDVKRHMGDAAQIAYSEVVAPEGATPAAE